MTTRFRKSIEFWQTGAKTMMGYWGTFRTYTWPVLMGAVITLTTPGAMAIVIDSTSVDLTDFLDAGGDLSFTDETQDWLLVGTADRDEGTTVSVSSGFELGAHLHSMAMSPRMAAAKARM
jgi:hypothetical protein